MYSSKSRRSIAIISLIGLVVLALLAIISVTLGAADISFDAALKIILAEIPFVGDKIDTTIYPKMFGPIVINLRLPRIILSIFVGSLLAASGTVYQSVFRNPMADPFILGIASGAALGAALAMIFRLNVVDLGLGSVATAAFVGALLTTFVVYAIATKESKTSLLSLILSGIAISYLLGALLAILVTLNRESLERIVFWMYGSFAVSSWNEVIVITPIFLLTVLLIAFKGRVLNVMTLGEEAATSLGVNVKKQRFMLLFITSIATAATVSVSGIIGFVGLIIPHLVRLVNGPDNRALLPFSMISGAIFLLLCDAVARIALPPMEIPIGIITSLFGAPYFIYLIIKNRRRRV